MKITVYYTQEVESSDSQDAVRTANKDISDVAFNFQNIYLKDLNSGHKICPLVEILLYYKDDKILWRFESEVEEDVKEMIRERLKSKPQLGIHESK